MLINREELNYKKILLAIVVLLGGVFLLFSVLWLLFFSRPETVVHNKEGGIAKIKPGSTLPNIQQGKSGNLMAGYGHLLSERQKLLDDYKQGNKQLLSTKASGALTKVNNLFDEKVAAVDYNGRGFIFLSKQDNKFYYLDNNGRKTLLSEESFPFVKRVVWSNSGNKVILEYPDGANVLYDFTQHKKITLPAEAEGFSFDSQDEKIAYKLVTDDPDSNWVIVSDAQNAQLKPLEPIGNKAASVQVSWSPDNQVVALYHEPRGLDKEEVYFLGLHNENFKSLEVAGSNFKGKWSPDGKYILYHVVNSANNYNPILWLASAANKDEVSYNRNLGLTTWVDKCIFAPQGYEVYCAVPVNLEKGAGLYPELVNKSEDVFYKIDLRSGLSQLIAYPVFSDKLDKFQAEKLFISPDGSKLYFWDKLTQKVYFMYLK